MTLILMVATFGVLSVLGVACRRARLDLDDQICQCLRSPVAAAVGFGPGGAEVVPAVPVLIPLEGGGQGPGPAGSTPTSPRGRRRHLRVVGAR